MPELSDEELETIRREAHEGGRAEREHELQETEQWQAIYETQATARRTEEKLDQLLISAVAAPPEVVEEAAAETAEAAEADPPAAAEQPEAVAAPPEPKDPQAEHRRKRPKFHIL